MRTISNSLSIIASALVSGLISGCTSIGIDQHVTTDGELSISSDHIRSLDKIAADFVFALVQLPELEPVSTTVQIEKRSSTDRFVIAVHSQLQKAGYGIRWINGHADNMRFDYRQVLEENGSLPIRHRFELAIGVVELRRTYAGVEDAYPVQPVTPLYVRGAYASHVVLNDAVFASEHAFIEKAVTQLNVRDDINPLSSWARENPKINPVSTPLLALPTIKNVFEIGESNHVDRLKEHSLVVERILTFPNDSLRLGPTNKQIIHGVVSEYNSHTDVFTVLGCSLGPTALKGGNAALALGRASRVKEALLFAGVEPDKIFDEGCWAGDSAGNMLPKRGVVLTLNRRM